MKTKNHFSLGALLLSLGFAGCAVGPDYHRPTVAAPAFKEAGDWKPAEPSEHVPRGKWWEAFGDPALNGLEDQIEVSSNTLHAAEAHYHQSLAALTLATSGLFPALDASASASRSQTTARANVPATPQHSIAAGVTADWEIDLWGRIRRGIEAGRASAEASEADLESVRLSLHATLAQTYFSLRVADTEAELYARTVADFTRAGQMTQNRYAQGVDTRADVAAAETQLKSAQAQAIDLSLVRAQLEHALAILLGEAPASFSLPAAKLKASPLPPPMLLPSELLERRPDIAAAERRLAAASAEIGVAKAGYFPALALSGSSGYQSSGFARLFSSPHEVWSLGAAAVAPLFNAGRVRAGVAQARAFYEENMSSYRQTVLSAFQEVEDNLAATRILASEADAQGAAVNAARQSSSITLNRYKAGTVSYLDVVTAQSAQLSSERAAADLLGRRLDASVTLLKAAGGDWTPQR